jgi:uncharacterized membrane protein YccF (DUF307 family)
MSEPCDPSDLRESRRQLEGDRLVTHGDEGSGSRRQRARSAVRTGGHWAGYGWFMSFGTVLPLIVFLAGYVVHITLIGAPIARAMYRVGIWLSTLGQEPPGKDKVEARQSTSGKKPFFERIRPYSPPGILERRGKQPSLPVRIVWFVLVGWWLGGVWVVVSWSIFLLPYPFLDAVASLLDELPSVMTLAWPETARVEPAPEPVPGTAPAER